MDEPRSTNESATETSQSASNGHSTQTVFSTNLRAWRKHKDLLLKQVSADLDVSISTFAAWEYGTRFATADHLDALGKLVECHTACLFCEKFQDCLNDGDGNGQHRCCRGDNGRHADSE